MGITNLHAHEACDRPKMIVHPLKACTMYGAGDIKVDIRCKSVVLIYESNILLYLASSEDDTA